MSTAPPANDVAARLAQLQAEIDSIKAASGLPAKPAPPEEDHGRRHLLTALLGGAAVATVLSSDTAEAQSLDSINDLEQGLTNALNDLQIPQNLESIGTSVGGSFDILSQAMSVLGQLGVPPQLMQLLRCLLGGGPSIGFNFDLCSALGGVINGPNSMLRTGNITPAMDAVWPAEPSTTPDGIDEETVLQYQAIREQVTASQATTATAAESQIALGEIDVATVEAIDAAAMGGSLITVLALLGHMMLGTNIRLSNLVQALNASQQSHGAHLLLNQHDRYESVRDRHRRRDPTVAISGGVNPLGGGGGGILTTGQ